MKWILMYVEWGFSSETYDFAYALVRVTGDGTIVKRLPAFLRIFHWRLPVLNYGYGYDARDDFDNDLCNRMRCTRSALIVRKPE